MRFAWLAILMMPLTLDAEVYTWVDENGKRHYSDQPPVEVEREVERKDYEITNIDRGYPPASAIPRDEKTPDPAEQARREADEERLAAACAQARERLRMMRGPVRFWDEDGNQVHVTEREREAMARDLEKEIQQRCE